ncbi:MAG: hypothetical protein H8E86_02225, partial [Planctomycetes bacterium]|nr:hypothetical protein [Planctomycetota bacterium]
VRAGAPLAVLQRTWSVGMLAAMKCSPLLTPNSRSYAAELQPESINTCDASTARAECLDLITQSLLETTEFDSLTLMQWEAWMIATSSIANQESRHVRYMRVIKAIVNSKLDLLRESNTRKVLGRILLENETIKSEPFRDGVLSLYKDRTTTSVDLYVLGNLFYASGNSTWFSPQFILNVDASAEERESATSLLAQTWEVDTKPLPIRTVRALPNMIDSAQLQRWQELYTSLDRHSGLATFLIQTRLLNEAALYLFRGRSDLVEKVFTKLNTITVDAPPILSSVYYEETDGKWTSTFNDSKSEALSALKRSGATVLGTKDASTLARAALAMQSNQIRAQATDIIISQFYNDNNLAVAMLDYVGNYKSKKELSKLVANLTEIILPERTSANWDNEARRAIVQHAISTIEPEQKQLDYISNELTISLLDEFVETSPLVVLSSTEYTSLEAMRLLVKAKRKSHDDDSVFFIFTPSNILQHYLHNQLEYYYLTSSSIFDSGSNAALFANKLKSIVQNDRTIIEQIASVEFLITSSWDLFFSQTGIATNAGDLSR